MSHDVAEEKRALRAELRSRRRSLSDQQRESAASGVTEQLDALVAEYDAGTISCFLSTAAEPGTHAFVSSAAQRGIRVLLPISRADGQLDWAAAEDDVQISEGLFGLPEPVGDILARGAIDDVDLMIIPAAAVDGEGTRLGWGRGYFDRTIGSLRSRPPVYAVVFDSEILDSLPREMHDQPVTGAVTPTRTLHLSHSRH